MKNFLQEIQDEQFDYIIVGGMGASFYNLE